MAGLAHGGGEGRLAASNCPCGETKLLFFGYFSARGLRGGAPHAEQRGALFFGLMKKRNIGGPIIRRLRKGHDWTQKEFAKRLREAGWRKCDRLWVSRLESGRAALRDLDLPYLQAVLGETFTAEMFGFIVKQKPIFPLDEEELDDPLDGCRKGD